MIDIHSYKQIRGVLSLFLLRFQRRPPPLLFFSFLKKYMHSKMNFLKIAGSKLKHNHKMQIRVSIYSRTGPWI